MPAGLDYSSAISYGAFAVVKLAAYALYAHHLGKDEAKPPSAVGVGAIRTALGMGVGAAYFGVTRWLTHETPAELLGTMVYWASLFPLRVVEWWVILKWLYPNHRDLKTALLAGIGMSYLADLPATLGWLVTGGLSIC